MSRNEKCEKERNSAWNKSDNVQQRINELEKVASKYPEEMILMSDIAVSYLEISDTNNVIKTYQKIIDRKDSFELRARSKITWHFRIPSSGYLCPILNRKILEIARYSGGFAISDRTNLT